MAAGKNTLCAHQTHPGGTDGERHFILSLHNIRGIQMLPRSGFGFEVGDMKYYDDECIVIFLKKPYTLDITFII